MHRCPNAARPSRPCFRRRTATSDRNPWAPTPRSGRAAAERRPWAADAPRLQSFRRHGARPSGPAYRRDSCRHWLRRRPSPRRCRASTAFRCSSSGSPPARQSSPTAWSRFRSPALPRAVRRPWCRSRGHRRSRTEWRLPGRWPTSERPVSRSFDSSFVIPSICISITPGRFGFARNLVARQRLRCSESGSRRNIGWAQCRGQEARTDRAATNAYLGHR
jgi:hypothetical protein